MLPTEAQEQALVYEIEQPEHPLDGSGHYVLLATQHQVADLQQRLERTIDIGLRQAYELEEARKCIAILEAELAQWQGGRWYTLDLWDGKGPRRVWCKG